MNRLIQLGVALILCTAATQSDAFGRGFGGFHGGGFGGGGGAFGGGFHTGGFGGGSFGGGGFSGGGFHASSFGGGGEFGSSGFHAGAFDSGGFHAEGLGGGFGGGIGGEHAGSFDAGGARTGGYGGDFQRSPATAGVGNLMPQGFDGDRSGGYGGSLNRGQLNGFLGLPTDSGMHAAGGADGERGAVAGPGGAAAGGKVAGGTVVRGPEGNVYARGTTAGRGVAAGTNGAVAGRGYYGAYGTHEFSPTYAHAQGLAAQRWCDGTGSFTPAWSAAHPWAWLPAGYAASDWAAAAWNPAAWPALGAWFAWDATPAYYDYGNNVTYQGDDVYYGTQPEATQQQYYQQAANLANAEPAAPSGTEVKWLPLGVFGLMAQGQKTPEMVFQLALDKAGAIRGNYYDQMSDTTAPVTGSVDKKDQRAAWRVGANKSLVIETGLYNLTLDRSTALVHYGPDETQQYVLVRLKQPEQQKDASSAK